MARPQLPTPPPEDGDHQAADQQQTSPPSPSPLATHLIPAPPDLSAYPQIGHRPRFARLYRLPDGTVVKTGRLVRPTEARTLAFVRRRTTVPVPAARGCWRDPATGHWCLRMDGVAGALLADVYELLGAGARRRVAAQLRGFVAQMRALETGPGGPDRIAAVDGEPARDVMLQLHQGVYSSETAFRRHIVDGFLDRTLDASVDGDEDGCCDDEEDEEDDEDVREVRDIEHRLLGLRPAAAEQGFVFTHGDLTPRNVVVDEDGRVTGILDWSQAGYYPAYWEYAKACCYPRVMRDRGDGELEYVESGFVVDGMPDVILPWRYPTEAAVLKEAYEKAF
ncbi:hypothetical protein JX266_005360 [Neoarthrinium moseri]|nr:hypothetical protein JX266_005360 [Neoarthrinium moseri]